MFLLERRFPEVNPCCGLETAHAFIRHMVTPARRKVVFSYLFSSVHLVLIHVGHRNTCELLSASITTLYKLFFRTRKKIYRPLSYIYGTS